MPTDTTERGLEVLIVRAMTGRTDILVPDHVTTVDRSGRAATGWRLGNANHCDREYRESGDARP